MEGGRNHGSRDRPRRVLAIASAGGHWAQLMLLREAFTGCETIYATTLAGVADRHGLTARLVPDCNRHTPLAVVRALWSVYRLIIEARPDVVVSTGALPGLIALAFAKLGGRRAVWVESIANADVLSMSGRLARRIADSHFVQWPDLAERTGTRYAGAVL